MINFQVFLYLVNKIQDNSRSFCITISSDQCHRKYSLNTKSRISDDDDDVTLSVSCTTIFFVQWQKCLLQIGFLQYQNYLQTFFTRKIWSVIF